MPKDANKKPQPTLEGYTLWAFARLVRAKGVGPGPTAGWIIDRWIDDNRDFLEQKFGISRHEYDRELEGTVQSLARRGR